MHVFAAWLAVAPAVDGASIRLFAQPDGTVLPLARRLYSTHFDALRLRALGVEVSVAHAAGDGASELALDCVLARPDGSRTPADRPLVLGIAAGQARSSTAELLWRVPEEADWQPGDYAIECRAGDAVIAAAAFDVTLNPPDVAGAEIRVAALRIFPVDRELPPRPDRRYAQALAAAETRHLGVELEFTHQPLGRELRIPVECWYFWPDGQTSPPVLLSYEPQPSWSGGYSAGALGWDKPGHWLPGVYTVSCSIHGRPVVVDRFDLD